MFNLSGKKALITGGSRGIGAAIAKAFVEAGATVIITGTNEEKLKGVSDSLGSNCSYCVANLSDDSQVANLVKEQCGELDILVNNAGITKDGLLMRMKDEDWDAVINLNLSASFKIIKGSIRGMMKKRHGRIINISSVVGSAGNPGQANYCASKAGLLGLTKSIALEVASRGITVNCISPGFIQTDMTNKLNEDQSTMIKKSIPSGEMGNPKDIASTATFLASDEANYITGQNIHVNGGLYLAA